MPNYLHTLSIASVSGQKYAYYFKKRAATLDYSNALSLNHCYQGFIGRSTKSGNFINTKIIDTNTAIVGLLSTFSESIWLKMQNTHNILTLSTGRDLFNPKAGKSKLQIQLLREPEAVFFYGFDYGSPYNKNPYVNYIFQAYEGFNISQSVLGNYGKTSLDNIYQGEARTRSVRHYFLAQATHNQTTPYSLISSNVVVELYENAFETSNIYFTSRYAKTARSPKVITNAFAVTSEYGRFFGNTCVVDMPDPTEKDYKEGAGRTELLVGFIGVTGSFNLFAIGINDDQFFSLEKWADNEWTTCYGTAPDEDGEMLGWLPNLLGEPIGLMLNDHSAIYISGVRAHFHQNKKEEGKEEPEQSIESQTAVIKLNFEYNKEALSFKYTGMKIIEHDASGTPDNFEALGGTDKDDWNIYHTLWGANINNHEVVLVNNTRHKRFKESSSNFLGHSVENEDDIKTYLHLYIDDKVYPFDCETLGFYPAMTATTQPLFSENLFDPRYADIITPVMSKKWGTVISDTELLLCMTTYPKKDKNLLVKLDINSRSFTVMREDPIAEGEAVATCYQRANKHTPACIIYRIGIQGGEGKVYLSKDTGKTWEKIADSQYTSGGGMYYLGGSHYSVNYGNAFSS